ncbi:MAG: trypsin-like peptidase domain-containing protein, partial [Pseudomonadota bacterium]
VALCLNEAPPATLEIGPEAGLGDDVKIVGYARPKVHVPTRAMCTVEAAARLEMRLDCPAARGASGGPVFDAEGRVVGVMSRTSPVSSVASKLPETILSACAG